MLPLREQERDYPGTCRAARIVRLTRPEEHPAMGAATERPAFDPTLLDGAFEIAGGAAVLDVEVSVSDRPFTRHTASGRFVRDAQER